MADNEPLRAIQPVNVEQNEGKFSIKTKMHEGNEPCHNRVADYPKNPNLKKVGKKPM